MNEQYESQRLFFQGSQVQLCIIEEPVILFLVLILLEENYKWSRKIRPPFLMKKNIAKIKHIFCFFASI